MKISGAWPASTAPSAKLNGNPARVGSSLPEVPTYRILAMACSSPGSSAHQSICEHGYNPLAMTHCRVRFAVLRALTALGLLLALVAPAFAHVSALPSGARVEPSPLTATAVAAAPVPSAVVAASPTAGSGWVVPALAALTLGSRPRRPRSGETSVPRSGSRILPARTRRRLCVDCW